MSDNYWTRTRRGVEGPFTKERLAQLVAQKSIGQLDEVSADGRTWTRVWKSDFWWKTNASSKAGFNPQQEASKRGGFVHPRSRLSPERLRASMLAPQMAQNASVPPPLPSEGRRGKLQTYEEEMRGLPPPLPRRRILRKALFFGVPAACIALTVVFLGLTSSKAVPQNANGAPPTTSTTNSATPEENRLSASESATEPDYPGIEVGGIDPKDFKPKFQPVVAYLTPSYSELRQMLQIILASPHVANNPLYSGLTKQIRLNHYPEDDTVNAFASGYDEQREEGWPTMVVLGGAGRFARLVGAVIATEELYPRDDIKRYSLLFSGLADYLEENGEISIGDTGKILDDCRVPIAAFQDESWLPRAKQISMGVLMGIMAHEVGHIALGHVLSGSRTRERTRNQEREADSFASSIGSGEWYAVSMFWGQLYFHLVVALNETDGENDTGTNHPFSQERLINLVRSNRALAEKCGFTEEGMREFLGKIHK